MKGIININKRGFKVDFKWVASLETVILKKFKIKKLISIALVTSEEIKTFNRVYRQKNKVTDVLSFNLDNDLVLGEVVICLDQLKKQAQEKNKTIKAELQLLTVHGILHLLGYDHERSHQAAQKQEKMEKSILQLLN